MSRVEWRLRAVMHRQKLDGPTALADRLAHVGLALSLAQLSRLITRPPRRVGLELLAALCDVLECGPADLLLLTGEPPRERRPRQFVPPEVRLQ